MFVRRILRLIAGITVVGLLVAAYLTRHAWLPESPSNVQAEDTPTHAAAGEPQQVQLTPQAQSNLRLVSKPLKVDTFWRTIQVPGMVVDRPAYSDRGIVSPVTGVVTKVHYFPGDTVKSGDTLFTLRLLSETLHLAQSEL